MSLTRMFSDCCDVGCVAVQYAHGVNKGTLNANVAKVEAKEKELAEAKAKAKVLYTYAILIFKSTYQLSIGGRRGKCQLRHRYFIHVAHTHKKHLRTRCVHQQKHNTSTQHTHMQ